MTMAQRQLGAWVETPGKQARIEMRQIEIPSPGPGEVLVQMEVSGVWYVERASVIVGHTYLSTVLTNSNPKSL